MLRSSLHHEPAQRPPSAQAEALGDTRFRALLSAEAWAALPLATRRRFSHRLAAGDSVVYTSRDVTTVMSRAGFWLAQLARLIGGPLPLARGTGLAGVVTVTEDFKTGGQHWTRLVARRGGFPQMIHSSKRFAGPTGLEEYIGRGVGIALTVHVENQALVFRGAHYFVQWLGRRWRLPRWLEPGALAVTHRDLGQGRFAFTLDVTHSRLGPLVSQRGIYEETGS
jgi:Domain of unknown function (DUF4166)